MNNIMPLGIFGLRGFETRVDALRALSGAISANERAKLAGYLRSGAIVFAIMEYTRDKIGNAFGVSGGSAILTDGMYYWRRDAAEYVEFYGTDLPQPFLARARALGWRCPALAPEEVLEIDRYLLQEKARLP